MVRPRIFKNAATRKALSLLKQLQYNVLIALSGKSTVIINAHIKDGGIHLDNPNGALVHKTTVENTEYGVNVAEKGEVKSLESHQIINALIEQWWGTSDSEYVQENWYDLVRELRVYVNDDGKGETIEDFMNRLRTGEVAKG